MSDPRTGKGDCGRPSGRLFRPGRGLRGLSMYIVMQHRSCLRARELDGFGCVIPRRLADVIVMIKVPIERKAYMIDRDVGNLLKPNAPCGSIARL